MSQYPSPYTPPPWQPSYGYYPPPQDFSRHARRASTLMFILGGLILLLGVCNTLSGLFVPTQEALERQRQMFPVNAQMPFSAETLKAITIVSAVITMLVGAGLVTLGTGVRRGGTASTITSLVLVSILLLFTGLVTLASLLAGLAAPVMFVFACISAPAAAMFVLLVVWLVAALRAVSNWNAAQRQYQAQYWQYQQNMQAYGTPPVTQMPPPPASGSEPPRA
jgi:hypothetical protein